MSLSRSWHIRDIGVRPVAHNIILIMDSLKFSHFLLYERKTFLGNSLTAVSKIAVFSRQSELFEWELFIQFWAGKTWSQINWKFVCRSIILQRCVTHLITHLPNHPIPAPSPAISSTSQFPAAYFAFPPQFCPLALFHYQPVPFLFRYLLFQPPVPFDNWFS